MTTEAALIAKMKRRRTGARVELTDSERRIASAMRLRMGVCAAAAALSMSPDSLHRAVDPAWADMRRKQINKARGRMGLRGRAREQGSSVVQVMRDEALYDPNRDGAPTYASMSAEILGDPPIGRREMLEVNARATAERERSVWGGNWSF